jgi:RNA polymerase sigma-70 factor (ECF subfamily)
MVVAANSSSGSGELCATESVRADPIPPFRALYEQYFDFVWSCARRLAVPMAAIDDVVQEVFIVVHAKLPTLEQPASLRSWLYGIVRRTVSTHHRAQRSRTARESPGGNVDENANPMQPTPLDLAITGDELRLICQLLDELDDSKREILMLAELEDMTVPEIAEAVGIPLNTAYSRLRVARRKFNELFSRHATQRSTRGSRWET